MLVVSPKEYYNMETPHADADKVHTWPQGCVVETSDDD